MPVLLSKCQNVTVTRPLERQWLGYQTDACIGQIIKMLLGEGIGKASLVNWQGNQDGCG